MNTDNVKIKKTYKLFIGGKFPRSESARAYEVLDNKGDFLANAALASRKDMRDAVLSARNAQKGWATATAYNRGQVLYRVAEMMEDRFDDLAYSLHESIGVSKSAAEYEVRNSIDRWVYYAGWSDKWSALVSTVNPVASKTHNFTMAEPTGVVGIICPEAYPLTSFAELTASVVVSGNTSVVILPQKHPIPGMTMSEILAVSDVPGGVINILSGSSEELGIPLASHIDVNALLLCGVESDLMKRMTIEGANSVKRIVSKEWSSEEYGLASIEPFVEFKTTWHGLGW